MACTHPLRRCGRRLAREARVRCLRHCLARTSTRGTVSRPSRIASPNKRSSHSEAIVAMKTHRAIAPTAALRHTRATCVPAARRGTPRRLWWTRRSMRSSPRRSLGTRAPPRRSVHLFQRPYMRCALKSTKNIHTAEALGSLSIERETRWLQTKRRQRAREHRHTVCGTQTPLYRAVCALCVQWSLADWPHTQTQLSRRGLTGKERPYIEPRLLVSRTRCHTSARWWMRRSGSFTERDVVPLIHRYSRIGLHLAHTPMLNLSAPHSPPWRCCKVPAQAQTQRVRTSVFH